MEHLTWATMVHYHHLPSATHVAHNLDKAPQWTCHNTHKTKQSNREMVPIVFPPFLLPIGDFETLKIRAVFCVGLPWCDFLVTM